MTTLLPAAAATIAEVTRKDVRTGRVVVESWHQGLVAIVAPDGTVSSLGDPDAAVFVRSTVKPFQAIGCLEILAEHAPQPADGEERRGPRGPGRRATDLVVEPAPASDGAPSPEVLTSQELAVSWASHRGQPDQMAAAAALLQRIGRAPAELTCPPARPEDDQGATPTRLAYNCSGKHAMFALAGAAMGLRADQLLAHDGPLQTRLLGVLTDALGTIEGIAVDGCGAPAVSAPLVDLARAYQRLLTEPRWRAVVDAGLAHPELVGGTGRVESALLAAGVVAKVGAEGVYAAAGRDDDGQVWGVAVKAADGRNRASATALVTVLAGLGLVRADVWAEEPILGGGVPVGTVRASPAVAHLVAGLV